MVSLAAVSSAQWQANWIAAAEEQQSKAVSKPAGYNAKAQQKQTKKQNDAPVDRWYCFRRTVKLDSRPQGAIARIASRQIVSPCRCQ
jgi:hypothetical protein